MEEKDRSGDHGDGKLSILPSMGVENGGKGNMSGLRNLERDSSQEPPEKNSAQLIPCL